MQEIADFCWTKLFRWSYCWGENFLFNAFPSPRTTSWGEITLKEALTESAMPLRQMYLSTWKAFKVLRMHCRPRLNETPPGWTWLHGGSFFRFVLRWKMFLFFVNETNMVESVSHPFFPKVKLKMQWRGLHCQVVISPREAPSEDLQNPAVARQVLWCVFFFFIFFVQVEMKNKKKTNFGWKKMKMKKVNKMKKVKIWRWKQTMTTFFSLLFPSFSIYFCLLAPLHRPWLWVFEASWCPTMVAVLVAMPLVWDLNFVGPGAVRWLGWPSLEALKGRFLTIESTSFIYFLGEILILRRPVLVYTVNESMCIYKSICTIHVYIYTYTTYQIIYTTRSQYAQFTYFGPFWSFSTSWQPKPQLLQPDKCDHPGGSMGIHQGALEALEEVAVALRSAGLLGRRSNVMDVTGGVHEIGDPFFAGCEGGHELIMFFFWGGDLKKDQMMQHNCKSTIDFGGICGFYFWHVFGLVIEWPHVDGRDGCEPIGESHQKISKGCIQGEIGIISDGFDLLGERWSKNLNFLQPSYPMICVFLGSISELSQVGVGPMSASDTNKRQARSFHWEPSTNIKEICGKGIVGAASTPSASNFLTSSFQQRLS